jgi:TonB family protein
MKALGAGQAPTPVRVFAPDFRYCLAASVALHLAFVAFRGLHFAPPAAETPVEIDLTSPFIGDGPAHRAAPKRLIPAAKLPPAPVEAPLPPTPPKPVEQQPPKNWTLPGPDTQKLIPPKPETPPPTQGGVVNGEGTSHLQGGSGQGDPYGAVNGHGHGGAPAGMMRPKLLNRDEVLRNLRKYYPERERLAGHEGLVIVDIHLGADGSIGGVDVIQSASVLFDAAAVKVAHIMRFSPAQTPDGAAVPSKVRERMQFKLTDD